MKLEAEKLLQSDPRHLGWADRLRKARVFAPLVMFVYCLFVKGAIVNGRIGIYYAFQRMFSELLLSLYLIESDLNLSRQHHGNESVKVIAPELSAPAAPHGISDCGFRIADLRTGPKSNR
jgi:hypothetical protein